VADVAHRVASWTLMALCLKACGVMGSDTDRCVQVYVFNTGCYGFGVLDYVRVPQSYGFALSVCMSGFADDACWRQAVRRGESGCGLTDFISLIMALYDV
jgi:hypothetical protein